MSAQDAGAPIRNPKRSSPKTCQFAAVVLCGVGVRVGRGDGVNVGRGVFVSVGSLVKIGILVAGCDATGVSDESWLVSEDED